MTDTAVGRSGARGLGSPTLRLTAVPDHLDDSVGRLERRLDRVVEPRPVVRAHDEPVHDHGHVVVLPAVERGDAGQVVGLAVHPYAHEAPLPDVLEEVPELALAAAHDRREHLDSRFRRPGEDRVGDLRGALPGDRRAVVGTVRDPDPCPEQTEVVVDLGNGADGGARVLAGGLLLDRDGR
jgi:hypothetical protein